MAKDEYKPVTAQDAIAGFGPLSTDVENAKKAEEAGVVSAAYVDYEKALKNYESRTDIETLEQRLARESLVRQTFEDGAEVRTANPEVVHTLGAESAHAAGETDKFKAGQAKETNKVSDGRESASLEDVAKAQKDQK